MKVVLTGSAGCLARVLLPRLCAEPEVESVTGIDLRPAGFAHPKFRQQRLDIRSPRLAEVVAGADALIHAAFLVMPGSLGRRRFDRALIRDINVSGSTRVLSEARRAGLHTLVFVSSAAVYGAWPDNPERVTEERPLRPLPGFSYGEDKTAVEDWLDLQDWSGRRLVRLRPHAILGPHAQPLLCFLLRQPFYPRLPDPQPLTQCVWEDDVAEAVWLALSRPAHGSFNLAAEPAMAFRDMQRRRHRRPLPAPLPLAQALYRGLWQITGVGGEPGWLAGLRHPLALDCSRAHRELGWRPRHSLLDCLDRLPG